jgi:hypothetical protein
MEGEPTNVPPVTPNEPAEPVTPVLEPTDPTEPQVPEDSEALKALNKKLFERAKKAEDTVKALRSNPASNPSQVSPQLSVEETVLLANGMPEELVTELKSVAKVRGINSLLKAQSDPIFVAVKEKFEKDKKQKDASLSASRGSGGAQQAKTFSTPGLTREEHRKMVNDSR